MRKRNIIIVSILFVLSVAGGILAVRYLPGVVPYRKCSEVYKQYSKVEGVRATYVKDFRLNDTLVVGVTLLEATSDDGWSTLKDNFELIDVQEESGDGKRLLGLKLVTLKDSKDSMETYLCSYSCYRKSVCVYHTHDIAHQMSVVSYCSEQLTKIK